MLYAPIFFIIAIIVLTIDIVAYIIDVEGKATEIALRNVYLTYNKSYQAI